MHHVFIDGCTISFNPRDPGDAGLAECASAAFRRRLAGLPFPLFEDEDFLAPDRGVWMSWVVAGILDGATPEERAAYHALPDASARRWRLLALCEGVVARARRGAWGAG